MIKAIFVGFLLVWLWDEEQVWGVGVERGFGDHPILEVQPGAHP